VESDPVLTLADLESWSRPEPSLTVLGHPIGHSLSPPMHNAALAQLSRGDPRFSGWRYFRFDIAPEDLPRALGLLRQKHFRGVNLTVPHKVIAFDLVAATDGRARPVGAVNTLLSTPAGWRGFNTDGYGLRMGLRAALGLDLARASVLLLGAGGAARSAAVEALQCGCAALWLANRSQKRRDALLSLLRPLAGPIPVRAFDPADSADFETGAIVINSTSAGLRPGDGSPLDLGRLPRPAGVYDMIYNPPRTPLLLLAEKAGIPCANGLSMLVHQGAKALEIWTGVPAPELAPAMAAAVERLGKANG